MALRTQIKIGKPADDFFEYLLTPAGRHFLDPSYDTESDHLISAYPEPFSWGKDPKCLINVEYARFHLSNGCFGSRDAIISNAYDPQQRQWHCRSVLIPKGMGFAGNTTYSTIMGDAIPSSEGGRTRIAYASTYSVEDNIEASDECPICTLNIFQWIDLQGWMTNQSLQLNKLSLKSLASRADEKFPVTSTFTEVSTTPRGTNKCSVPFFS